MVALEHEPEHEPLELPRDNLVRGMFPADQELRDNTDQASPTLFGHFAMFNEWTEIKSMFEGNFLERISPGAFKKTMREQTPKVLFQHGRDPQIGDKVLGIPDVLEEDDQGARYEVPLFDTAYNRELLPGLRAGAYGASFRFQVMKETIDQKPEMSDHNPSGLPERTIQEVRLMELGPVTFPAYEGATAGVRSLTDEFMAGRSALGADANTEPAVNETQIVLDGRALADTILETQPIEEEEPTHSQVSRDTPSTNDRANNETEEVKQMDSIEEMRARQDEIVRELQEIAAEHRGQILGADEQTRYDQLKTEWDDLDKRYKAETARMDDLERMAGAGDRYREPGTTPADTYVTKRAGRDQVPDNPFALEEYHGFARSQEQMYRLFSDGARKAVETFHYPHERANREDVNEHITHLIEKNDGPDKEIALRLLTAGGALYSRAFFKKLGGQPLTTDEARALAAGVSTATGGAMVPIQIDPTIIPTSSIILNPLRSICRVQTTTAHELRQVTSGAVTVAYGAELAISSDNSPTLAQPTFFPERVQGFVPFSWELAQDVPSLEANLAILFQDAKDYVEAQQFITGGGHGANQPFGLYSAGSAARTVGSGTATLHWGAESVFAVENKLDPRYLARAVWLASINSYQRVRGLDTPTMGGGYGGGAFWNDLRSGNPPELIGYPAYKMTNVGTVNPPIANSVWGIFVDPNAYQIVDRVGFELRMIDNIFSAAALGTVYPTGESGLMAFWRNTAGPLDVNAIAVATIS